MNLVQAPIFRILEHEFEFLGTAILFRNSENKIIEFDPKGRYVNKRGLPLNRHGNGPFCKFKVGVNKLPPIGGIYALTVDGRLTYIGICENLEVRFGPAQYGNISPKNCYRGGQSTNCKINHNLLVAAKKNSTTSVWFLKLENAEARELIEADIIRKLAPIWNDQGKLS